MPPENLPENWSDYGGIWSADTVNKTFGSQSLRGVSLSFNDGCLCYVPNDWISKYQYLKIDVRTDSASDVNVRLEDSDHINQDTKNINGSWVTFEIPIQDISINNDAQLQIRIASGVSCNIDNLRGVL